MISIGTHEVNPLHIGGKTITHVYVGDTLVYPSVPHLLRLEIDGSKGTQTGTCILRPGRYRICMTGGGGNGKGHIRRLARINKRHYYGFWAASGGGAVYGILNITKNTSYSYSVGAIACDTKFGTLTCGAGIIPNATTCTTTGMWDDVRPKALSGGIVSGTLPFESWVINSTGNKGGTAFSQGGSSPRGGASLLSYNGGVYDDYPAINYNWGKGSDYSVDNATAGYLLIEKIN